MKQPRRPAAAPEKTQRKKVQPQRHSRFVMPRTETKLEKKWLDKAKAMMRARKLARQKFAREGPLTIKGVFDAETGLSVFHDPKSGAPSLEEAFDVVVVDKHKYLIRPEALKALKNYSDEEIHDLVVPKRTLARRQAAREPLSVEETDKAVRLGRIDKMAEKIFGDASKAHRWLRKPKRSLEGDTPLACLSTEAGARAVEEMLNQIDHGIIP